MSALHTLVPLAGSLPGNVGQKLNTVIGWVTTVATALCGVGVVICGIMMAISARRGEGGEHMARLGWVLAGCVVIGAATAITGAVI